MAADLHVVARDLFAAVMAPLGARRRRAARARHRRQERARADAGPGLEAAAADLLDRVQNARVRRARRLVPIDSLPPPTDAEWAMSAALHDVLQAANPTFEGTLRRSMARRILDVAIATLDRIPPPRTAADALSRHSWFARVPALTRTDTSVSWWSGSRVYRGVAPPARLQAWPGRTARDGDRESSPAARAHSPRGGSRPPDRMPWRCSSIARPSPRSRRAPGARRRSHGRGARSASRRRARDERSRSGPSIGCPTSP